MPNSSIDNKVAISLFDGTFLIVSEVASSYSSMHSSVIDSLGSFFAVLKLLGVSGSMSGIC